MNMINQASKFIHRNYITIISGGSRSGKTCLVSQLGFDYYLVDEKKRMLREGRLDIPETHFNEIVSSNAEVIIVDEAQGFSSASILNLAKVCAKNQKRLVLVSQRKENLPLSQLSQCWGDNVTVAEVELSGKFQSHEELPEYMMLKGDLCTWEQLIEYSVYLLKVVSIFLLLTIIIIVLYESVLDEALLSTSFYNGTVATFLVTSLIGFRKKRITRK